MTASSEAHTRLGAFCFTVLGERETPALELLMALGDRHCCFFCQSLLRSPTRTKDASRETSLLTQESDFFTLVPNLLCKFTWSGLTDIYRHPHTDSDTNPQAEIFSLKVLRVY